MNNNENSRPMRNEKYESPEYPQWLCEEGRALYDRDLKFRCNCEQYGHNAEWRHVLNREVQRLANAE